MNKRNPSGNSAPAAQPRRSVLYLPASNTRALEKSRGLAADSLVFDLEDAVAPSVKQQARDNLAEAFSQGGFGHSETVIRTNAPDTAEFAHDLLCVKACNPQAILLPKVSTLVDLELFATRADDAGLPDSMNCWFMIETAAGIVNLAQLIAAGVQMRNSLSCLAVGTNDIAKETGVATTNNRFYLMPWLMNIVLAAKHGNVQVLDGVWNDFKNTEGFEAETIHSAAMGFDGKTLIHPSQLEPANRIFSPNPADVARAREIIAAFELAENAQQGVINLGGEMVERLHLEQAQKLIELAERISASS